MNASFYGPVSRFYLSQRLRLHYADWGNSAAPPLVMLHGGRDHCRSWDWVAQRLRKDWHIIAPDLRGHGDSAWSPDGNYSTLAHIQDLAELIDQQNLRPVTIVAHSFGAHISLRYAGIFPDNVKKLVEIEGVWPQRAKAIAVMQTPVAERLRKWLSDGRILGSRKPRRYPTIEAAFQRMMGENRHLSPDKAFHLTQHGVNQNEDGSFSWKFDNLVRMISPHDVTIDELEDLWSNIICPTLHVYGQESRVENPETTGRMGLFHNARLVKFDRAGHWVHHDRLEAFVETVREFLAAD